MVEYNYSESSSDLPCETVLFVMMRWCFTTYLEGPQLIILYRYVAVELIYV